MNKFIIILCLLSFSCSDNNIVEPDLEIPSIDNSEIYISFHHSSIGIFSKHEVISDDFRINNQNIPIDEWITSESEFGGITYISSSDIPSSIEYSPGNDLSFELQINEMLFEGVIELPYKPELDWPVLNFDKPLDVSWSLVKSPEIQNLWVQFVDNTLDYTIAESWFLDGDIRKKTISREYFKHLDENSIIYLMHIECRNYVVVGNNVALASSLVVKYY